MIFLIVNFLFLPSDLNLFPQCALYPLIYNLFSQCAICCFHLVSPIHLVQLI